MLPLSKNIVSATLTVILFLVAPLVTSQEVLDVCDRTLQVKETLVVKAGVDTCDEVTNDHL